MWGRCPWSGGTATEGSKGMSAHALLGVAVDASADEIKAAYRRRARELHPDRHVGPDGTITEEAHEAFCSLNRALDTALAVAALPASAPRPGTSVGSAGGRTGGRTDGRGPRSSVPPQRRCWDRVQHADAAHALLTLPARTSGEWSNEQIEMWALLVVPAGRRALAEAEAVAARAAGVSDRQARITATAHVLLGLALTSLGSRVELLADRVGPAYQALERGLPTPVVAALPARVAVASDRWHIRTAAGLVGIGLAGLAALQLDWLTTLVG